MYFATVSQSPFSSGEVFHNAQGYQKDVRKAIVTGLNPLLVAGKYSTMFLSCLGCFIACTRLNPLLVAGKYSTDEIEVTSDTRSGDKGLNPLLVAGKYSTKKQYEGKIKKAKRVSIPF